MNTPDPQPPQHPAPPVPEEFDVVVVGAGAAGCVLAARLSEDPAVSVLLIEAGHEVEGTRFSAPGAAGGLQSPAADWYWGDHSVPQPGLGGRTVPIMAARCLGGGSSVNTMMWVRGRDADYDGWAAAGATGWSWDEVAPVFRAIESFENGGDDRRGDTGPMTIQTARHLDPWASAVAAAADTLGLPLNPDYNSRNVDGAVLVQSNTRDGVRRSVINGYLQPARHRPNLTVTTGTRVERILTDGDRATGVVLEHGQRIAARRAVAVTAGTVRSPQLLMLSGIGQAAQLADAGIPLAHNIPGIGAGVHDHVLVIGLWPLDAAGLAPGWGSAEDQWTALHRGPLSTYMQVSVFKRFGDDETDPDVQFNFASVPAGTIPGVEGPALAVATILLTPRSRGHVRLQPSSPADAPSVDPEYLTDPHDREILTRAFTWLRDELGRQPQLADHLGNPLDPPPGSAADVVAAYITAHADSAWHLVGGCRIGTDPGAVVDPDLRVHGIEGLFVADASVIPTIPRGNVQAAVIMIAERAAAAIRRRIAPVGGIGRRTAGSEQS